MYKSCAQWPLEVYKGMYGDGISKDTHSSYGEAKAVCKGLERDGFGGEGKYFPIKTWVESEQPQELNMYDLEGRN